MASKGKTSEGTREHPWQLKTPSGTSEFLAFRDDTLDPPALVVKSGSTELRYHLRCINDLHSMLKSHGDWMLLGSADEQKPARLRAVLAVVKEMKPPAAKDAIESTRH